MGIIARAFNKLGGYDELAARFPGSPRPPDGPRWDATSVGFRRSMRYEWCVTVVVARSGLWLQARPPLQGNQAAVFLPWADIRGVEGARLFWMRAVRLTCGSPEAGTVTLPQSVWTTAAPLWSAAQSTRRPGPA